MAHEDSATICTPCRAGEYELTLCRVDVMPERKHLGHFGGRLLRSVENTTG